VSRACLPSLPLHARTHAADDDAKKRVRMSGGGATSTAVKRSRYEEDVLINNHTAVWGSWWADGAWGLATRAATQPSKTATAQVRCGMRCGVVLAAARAHERGWPLTAQAVPVLAPLARSRHTLRLGAHPMSSCCHHHHRQGW
jgi:hypothetical protein